MYTPWSSTTQAPPPPLDKPVWVDLTKLYGEPDQPDAGVDEPVPGGLLEVTCRVPGLLKRWRRSTDGRWFGCRPGLKLTVVRSTCRSFRQGRAARRQGPFLALTRYSEAPSCLPFRLLALPLPWRSIWRAGCAGSLRGCAGGCGM
jgi:hypothetical protein